MDMQGPAIIAGTLIVSTAVTWAFGATIGVRIARRHPAIARLVTGLLVPAAALAYGIVMFNIDVRAHPTSDWPAMGLLGMILMSGMSLLTTIPTAEYCLRRGSRTPGP